MKDGCSGHHEIQKNIFDRSPEFASSFSMRDESLLYEKVDRDIAISPSNR
jgi:hypothetical protein